MQSHSSETTHNAAAAVRCPTCGAPTKLVRIVPEKPGHELRTFKCIECEREVNELIKLD